MLELFKRRSVDPAIPTITEVMPPGLTRAEAIAEAAHIAVGEEVVADLRRHFVINVPQGSVVEVNNG